MRRISTRCGSRHAGREHSCGPRGHSSIRSGATSCAPSSVGSARPSAPPAISTCSSSTMREQVSLLGDEGTAVRGLVDGLERRRRKARASAVAALSEDRYLTLVDRLEDPQPPPAAPGASPTLAELWWAEFVRTRRRFERLDRKSSDDELHAARIRVKRTRYAAELAASELGVAGERFVEAAKRAPGRARGASGRVRRRTAHSRVGGGQDRGRGCRPHSFSSESARAERGARAEWPQAWRLLERRARKARP